MPACPYHQFGFDIAIHQPGIAVVFHALQGDAFKHSRSTSLQQVMVEFVAADAVANRSSVTRCNVGIPHAAGAKPSNWLESTAASVIIEINLQLVYQLRSDPAAANFVARKGLLV